MGVGYGVVYLEHVTGVVESVKLDKRLCNHCAVIERARIIQVCKNITETTAFAALKI